MNDGKAFEQDFIKSIPADVFKYRFKDGTASWGGQADNVRFQSFNICDFMVYNAKTLYLLELKSHKGKSIPLSCIREKQIEGLCAADEYENIIAGIVFNFREVEETYFVRINYIKYFIDSQDRKSIPIDWIRKCGFLIQQEKKRTRYRYDVADLLETIESVPFI
jgi:recombination protein U